MAKQTIDIGSSPNDGTGDTLRDGGDKINDNFTELYNATTDAAIKTAFDNEVSQVSVPEKTAGTETAVRQFSPADTASMVLTHAPVKKSGTPSDNQLAVWTDDETIEGVSGVTFDGSVLAVTGDITVTDDAYAAGWNGSSEVPTKNAVYDKIESISVGGGGETNTASNIGVGGVGLYDGKVSADLQFKNLNSSSGRLSITDDVTNNEVDFDVVDSAIDHDALNNYVANKHIDHSLITLTAGTMLSGGGTIDGNVTFNFDASSLTLEGSISGSEDWLVFWDNSAGAYKRLNAEDLPGGGGGSSTFDGLSDTNLTGLATGDRLEWDGSDWVNVTDNEITFTASRLIGADSSDTAYRAMTAAEAIAEFIDGQDIDMADQTLSQAVIKDYSVTTQSVVSSSNALTVNLINGNDVTTTLTENVTSVTIQNWGPQLAKFTLTLTQDGTGGRTFDLSWVDTWHGGTPTLVTTAGTVEILHLFSRDGGTTVEGVHVTAAAGAGSGDLLAANNLSDVVNAATSRTNLGLEIGTDVQAYHDILADLAGLTQATDKLPYFNSNTTAATTDLTAAGRALLDDADAAAQRTTLGLVIDTDVQAYSAVLAATTASFTTADETKLDGIEAGATADQSDAEIETAYSNQVPQVSSGEKTAGTETSLRTYSPQDIHDMIDDHAPAGGGGGDITTDTAWAAKGDIIAATADDTASVVSIGSDGEVLEADSGAANGVAWKAKNVDGIAINMQDQQLARPNLYDYTIENQVEPFATIPTIDVSLGNDVTINTTSAITNVTFSNWGPSGTLSKVGLQLVQDSTGGRTFICSTCTWVGETPDLTYAKGNQIDEFIFYTRDGGTTVYGIWLTASDSLEPYLIAMTGQSNAHGYCGGDDDNPAANTSAYYWTDASSGSWLNNTSIATGTPITMNWDADTVTDTNAGLWAVDEIITRTGRPVYFIIEAKGSQALHQWGKHYRITGITNASTAVVSYALVDGVSDTTANNPANGDSVYIDNVIGVWNDGSASDQTVNRQFFTVANVDTGAKTFELSGYDTQVSNGWAAYTSGGYASIVEGRDGYTNLKTAIEDAMADSAFPSAKTTLDALVIAQGESDSSQEDKIDVYQEKLEGIIAHWRQESWVDADETKFIHTGVDTGWGGDDFRRVFANINNNSDPNVMVLGAHGLTTNFTSSAWHWDTAAMKVMGKRIAKAIISDDAVLAGEEVQPVKSSIHVELTGGVNIATTSMTQQTLVSTNEVNVGAAFSLDTGTDQVDVLKNLGPCKLTMCLTVIADGTTDPVDQPFFAAFYKNGVKIDNSQLRDIANPLSEQTVTISVFVSELLYGDYIDVRIKCDDISGNNANGIWTLGTINHFMIEEL